MKDLKSNIDIFQYTHSKQKTQIYFRSIIIQSVAVVSLSLMVLSFQNCAKKSTSNVGEASSSSTASTASTTNPTNTSSTTNGYGSTNTNTNSSVNNSVNTSDSNNLTTPNSVTTAAPSYSISVVHRYYNNTNTDYIFSLDKISSTQIPNGYSYQGTGFYVYDRNLFPISDLGAKKMLQLRACLYIGSKPYHFTEVSNNSSFKCSDLGAGFSDEGLFGYLSQQQLSNSAPLYRCYWTGLTHLTTPNVNECVKLDSNKIPIANPKGGYEIMPYCNGQTVTTNCVDILGYAPTY